MIERSRFRKRSFASMNRLTGYGFVLPGVLFLLAFVGYPMVHNFLMSLQNLTASNLTGRVFFVGFDNYRHVIATREFQSSLLNTLVFTIACITVQFLIAGGLALMLSKEFPGNGAFRSLLLLSWILPAIVQGTVWRWMFAQYGVLNYILTGLGIVAKPIIWMASGSTAMFTVVTTQVWLGAPFIMLLLIGGISTIPPEIYEVSAIDGASKSQRFWFLTLPLLKPTIVAALTLGVIYTFKVFDLVFVMTGGGPANETELLATLSYKETFAWFDFGRGAAVSNILFGILVLAGIGFVRMTSAEEAQ